MDDARPRRGWLLPLVLGAFLVLLAATTLVLWNDRHDDTGPPPQLRPAGLGQARDSDDPAARAALGAARRAARAYFTLDHRRLDADLDRVRALLSPAFRARYDEVVPDLADRIRERRLTLTARLVPNATATEFLTASRAQVLVALDVTTRRGAGSTTNPYRARVVLERSGTRWVVSGLDEVGRQG